MMEPKTARALWENYLFLTEEMGKFLAKQEMELFNNLLKQREQLQDIIDRTADDGFKVSPEGRRLLKRIGELNLVITNKMQLLVNNGRRQNQAAAAYNVASTTAVSRLNWNR